LDYAILFGVYMTGEEEKKRNITKGKKSKVSWTRIRSTTKARK